MEFCQELVAGVLCVAFGIYEKLVNSVLHFFRDIKKNFKFLSCISIGVFLGIFLFGNILKVLFDKFYLETSFCCMGFILGSIPIVIKQANIEKVSILHILCFLLSFLLSLYLIILEKNQVVAFNTMTINYNYLILVGIITSAGIIIPAISKTVILMLFGIYEMYLTAISTLDFTILLPIFIGIGIGSLVFLILIKFLFQNFHSYTYSAIIGFALSSVFVIYPGFSFDITGFASIILFILCLIIGIKLNCIRKIIE